MARSLLPREHGSYFQLAIPLVGVWVHLGASTTTAALTIAAVCAFLALEPLSVAIGGRGARMQATDGRRARVRFILLALPALACGGFGLARAPAATAIIATVLALITAGVITLIARRAVHTFLGELLAMIGLTGASAVVATAAGLSVIPALERWAAWILGFAATMIAVHHLFARRTRMRPMIDVTALVLTAIAVLLPTALPLTLAAVAIGLIAPSVRQIREVGIAIAIVALLSALLL